MKAITTRSLAAMGFCLGLGLASGSALAQPVVRHGILAGHDGMTLYVFAKDQAHPGKSMCNGFCAKNWPPYLANASQSATGRFGFVRRDDGGMQWTYEGKPLYFFVKDTKPGQMAGEGFKGAWHVVRP